MKSRYLLGAGAALAVAFSCAEANAQFGWLGGPYPVAWYIGPEGGWTSLSNQGTPISTPPFRADVGATNQVIPNGPFFNNFRGSARYDSGFNAGGRLGLQKKTVTGTTDFRVFRALPAPAFSARRSRGIETPTRL